VLADRLGVRGDGKRNREENKCSAHGELLIAQLASVDILETGADEWQCPAGGLFLPAQSVALEAIEGGGTREGWSFAAVAS
jgi:hypothetical protein